jgi:hypothetical protein
VAGVSRPLLRILLVGAIAAAAAVLASSASSSVPIGRQAAHVRIAVTAGGQAVVSYRQDGTAQNVLLWGALNARPHPSCGVLHGPRCGPAQVQMHHLRIFAGGSLGTRILHSRNLCRPYDGPLLPHMVAACKAPDGSYWAAQSWVRLHKPGTTVAAGPRELRLSHWHRPLPKLQVKTTWVKAKRVYYDHLYGTYTYRGRPIYGLQWNRIGVPKDRYGRVVYFDTHDSFWGPGWRRAQGFLSKPANGEFCYSFWGKDWGSLNWRGQGDEYRAMAMGAGVLPDVSWGPAPAPGSYDPVKAWEAYLEQQRLSKGSKFCHPQRPR